MIALLIEKLIGKKPFPLKTNLKRSVWLETKLLRLLIETGVVYLTTILKQYDSIIEALSVEKRRSQRRLQLNIS